MFRADFLRTGRCCCCCCCSKLADTVELAGEELSRKELGLDEERCCRCVRIPRPEVVGAAVEPPLSAPAKLLGVWAGGEFEGGSRFPEDRSEKNK